MGRVIMAVASASLVLALAGCRAQAPTSPPAAATPATAAGQAVSDLQQKTARFAVTDLTADLSALPANEREALAHMVRAAQVMDALFLEQVWSGNETTFHLLAKDDSPLGRARLHAFLVNKDRGRGWTTTNRSCRACPRSPPRPTSILRARPRRKWRNGSPR